MAMNEARRVVTVERNTEWEDGFARPRVMLQPFAAPSVLGLYGFAAATFMVALHLTGVYGGVKTNDELWPFAAIRSRSRRRRQTGGAAHAADPARMGRAGGEEGAVTKQACRPGYCCDCCCRSRVCVCCSSTCCGGVTEPSGGRTAPLSGLTFT